MVRCSLSKDGELSAHAAYGLLMSGWRQWVPVRPVAAEPCVCGAQMRLASHWDPRGSRLAQGQQIFGRLQPVGRLLRGLRIFSNFSPRVSQRLREGLLS